MSACGVDNLFMMFFSDPWRWRSLDPHSCRDAVAQLLVGVLDERVLQAEGVETARNRSRPVTP